MYQAADNQFLQQTLAALFPLSLRLWHVALSKLGDKKDSIIEYTHIVEHQAILAALQAGDPPTAADLMRRHVAAYQQYIENIILGKSAQLQAA